MAGVIKIRVSRFPLSTPASSRQYTHTPSSHTPARDVDNLSLVPKVLPGLQLDPGSVALLLDDDGVAPLLLAVAGAVDTASAAVLLLLLLLLHALVLP